MVAHGDFDEDQEYTLSWTKWFVNPANGHFYKLHEGGDWETCEQEATDKYGADLVTINDGDEQTWLTDIFGGNTRFWIGYTDKDEEGNWKWISGETSGYTNWNTGEPSNSGDCEDFAIMRPDGKWGDLGLCSPIWPSIKTAIIEKGKCDPIAVKKSPRTLKLFTGSNRNITLAVTMPDGCPADGVSVYAKIDPISKQFITLGSPGKVDTDANGKAKFTIKAKNKAGKAKVKFKAGAQQTKLDVKVIK